MRTQTYLVVIPRQFLVKLLVLIIDIRNVFLIAALASPHTRVLCLSQVTYKPVDSQFVGLIIDETQRVGIGVEFSIAVDSDELPVFRLDNRAVAHQLRFIGGIGFKIWFELADLFLIDLASGLGVVYADVSL